MNEPFSELETAVNLVKASLPTVPIAVIEAYSELVNLQVPTAVDWVGFDRYGTPDPTQDPDYLADLAMAKSKLSRPEQRLVLIPEGQHWPEYVAAGYPPEAMGGVATQYFALAQGEPEVIALVAYLWPGGLDGPTHLGTRNLPQSAIDAHIAIGRAITGK